MFARPDREANQLCVTTNIHEPSISNRIILRGIYRLRRAFCFVFCETRAVENNFGSDACAND